MIPTVDAIRTLPRQQARKQSAAHAPTLLHEFFDHAARRWPDRVAIDVPPASGRPDRRVISYSELQRQCDALASFLRDFVKEECVVAILLPRESEHLYLAQLAVLKAGAAYTCIDPLFPDEQIRDILDDCAGRCGSDATPGPPLSAACHGRGA